MRLLALIACAVMLGAAAPSQAPPGNQPPNEGEQTEGAKAKGFPASAASRAATVQKVQAPAPQPGRQGDHEKPDRPNWVESGIFWTGVAQSVIGAFGLAGLVFTVIYAKRAWSTAERTLRETTASAERQLRAYVHVSKASFRDTVEGAWVELTFQNFGQTPAHDTWIERAASVRDYPLTEALAPVARDDGLFDLAPNAVAGKMIFPFAEWDDPSPNRLDQGGTALYLHGAIHYRDAFGKERATSFRYYMRNRTDPGIAPADQGNTST